MTRRLGGSSLKTRLGSMEELTSMHMSQITRSTSATHPDSAHRNVGPGSKYNRLTRVPVRRVI
jgi:hypothetical protein